ncbi:type VII secretion protein EccB [Pseudonocardiaceae bacterium YIM PH 21723]|nr:type VII secretion protein EccB [Pseudonocardiaceae bacterium YIM PH 21723]
MPSTPTTKSQVQAYKFVLRRMESALVRKDPILLHDPMSGHLRAVTGGIALAVVIGLAFLAVGFFNPKSGAGDSGIVRSSQSGAVYVIGQNPRRLIPMLNVASARLLILAQNPNSNGDQLKVNEADEGQLADISRDRLTGIVGAPDWLPDAEHRAAAKWQVCDAPDPDKPQHYLTSVLVDAGTNGELGEKDIIPVKAAGTNDLYLIYRVGKPDSRPDHARVVRSKIDTGQILDNSDEALRRVYNVIPSLAGQEPREISKATLSAIPEARAFAAPVIDGMGERTTGTALVGDIGTTTEFNGPPKTWVVLKNGKQEVTPMVAKMIKYLGNKGKQLPGDVPSADLERVGIASTGKLENLNDYPSIDAVYLSPSNANRAVCFQWSGEGKEVSTVSLGERLPIDNDDKGQPMRPVQLIGADGEKDNLDGMFMKPGRGGVVHAANSEADFKSGAIFLVSDRGVAYGVRDAKVAKGLGLGETNDFGAAPTSILRLLPRGPGLNPDDARRTYDTPRLADCVTIVDGDKKPAVCDRLSKPLPLPSTAAASGN